jgi:hypothetical protein
MNAGIFFARGALVIAASAAAACHVGSQPAPPAPRASGHGGPLQASSAPAETFHPASPRQTGSAFIYLAGNPMQRLVNYEIVDGMAVIEGDILLGPASVVPFRYAVPPPPSGNVKGAVALASRSHLWPSARIPYEIDRSVSETKRGWIAWASEHLDQTSLKLRPRTATDRDYVIFQDRGPGSGCSSYLGRIGGSQDIQIGGCGKGSIVHEVLHAAGFYHEQSRGDRDEYITIVWDEIAPAHRLNFEMRDARGRDIGPYDFESILHYSTRAFSRTGKPTIIPKVPDAPIGQREGLSRLDRAAIEDLYGGGGAPAPAAPTQPPTTPAQPPPAQPAPVTNTGFAGRYTSSRGDVTCTQNGATVNCQYPGGALLCSASGPQLDCGWSGGGAGRALFQRQPNGVLAGTWGDFFSNNSRGPWELVPAGGAPGPAPAAPSTPMPAPGPAPAPAAAQAAPLAGNYASTRGPMSCTESATAVACTFQDAGVNGRLDCGKDASGLALSCTWMTFLPRPGSGRAVLRRASVGERHLTGTWGHFYGTTDGGRWDATGQ